MKHTSSPGKKGKKGKKSGKRKGLRGFVQEMTSEVQKPLGVVAGMIIGTVTANGVNYLVGVEKDSPWYNKLAGSAVTTAAGITVSYVGKKSDFVKHAGYGMTATGVYKGVRVFVTDDLFPGFNPLGEAPSNGASAAIVEETKREIQKLLEQNQPAALNDGFNPRNDIKVEEMDYV